MSKPKVGLLPLYIKLYDDSWPEMRPRVDGFSRQIAAALAARGLEVSSAPVCRVAPEFKAVIRRFERAKVDAIVTLHLAYSPSLESSAALAATPLPLVVLDTTPTYEYGPRQNPEELLYNHGIHGVQDMCNLLLRHKKVFQIEAGHWEKGDVLDRVAGWARAARLVAAMKRARIGRLGPAFKGMGDFAVAPATLAKTLGVKTVVAGPKMIPALLAKVTKKAVEAEMAADREQFVVEDLDPEMHRRATRAGLAVRRWLEEEELTGFTVNFMAADKASGLPAMPFLEASKAMARGIGYAGEGDVLTASLVGTLLQAYPDTSFTEMFCPDWEGNQIFLSHMGEMNLKLAATKPRLVEKPFPFTDVGNTAVAYGRFRAGEAVLVNLAPGPDDTYTLIVAPVVMQKVEDEDKQADSIHGWFKAPSSVADFLAAYSRVGGTHHSALVYGKVAAEIMRWGKLMEWNTVLLA
jgi:L-arabinose isomerase